MSTVINIFGGPGAGKSTLAAGMYFYMKTQGHSVELVTEFAKDKVWEGSTEVLKNQLYVMGKQQHRVNRLVGKVDYIITDSPILNSVVYSNCNTVKKVTKQVFALYNNKNIFLIRSKDYVQAGRNESEAQAHQKDKEIKSLLKELELNYSEVSYNNSNAWGVVVDLVSTVCMEEGESK